MMPAPRVVAVQRDGRPTIVYDVAGHGPPVVFIHGLTSNRRAWDPVSSQLVQDFTCLRVDLRGHGQSSAAPDYSMQSLVGDVRAVIEDIGLGEPAVVGHSLGASVAAIYGAAYHPRAVVCVDQSLRFGDFAKLVQAHADRLQGPHTMDAVLSIEHSLRLEPYARIEELERRVLAFPREVVLGVWHALLTTGADELTATAEALLPRISAPLLSLHGSPPPPDYESWLTRLVLTAGIEVWEGTGHMLHLVDPARFISRIRPLLADRRGVDAPS